MHPATGGAGQDQYRRPDNLALAFQEVFTVIERLRANRQAVSDAASFRWQFREALKAAEQEARSRGYTAEDIQLAIFATVAFLDESILNLRNPIFADWPRQPLQEELFGLHIAGEVFFQNLQKLLGRSDSHDLADLLEIYYLCLLLGFAGRYSIGGRGELRAVMEETAAKIRRIRQPSPEFSPGWMLPSEPKRAVLTDPWVKRWGIIACASLLFAVALFVIFKLSLGSGVGELGTWAARGRV
ncbi:MAG: DotU family type IV/VI secretion system protein [Bryobacterales bacterium]|nr:DotU family type IV/VI secretion system protein [Bryobacterales bacterium]